MGKPYKISVNNQHHFNINPDDLTALDAVETDTNCFHILENHKSFTAEICQSDFLKKSYTVKINNTIYHVSISDHIDLLIKQMGFQLASSKQIDAIKAPMPGLILDIPIQVGDNIALNDTLIVLEAMKMENSIVSPRQGVIKSIGVKKGETVDKGELLIEFE